MQTATRRLAAQHPGLANQQRAVELYDGMARRYAGGRSAWLTRRDSRLILDLQQVEGGGWRAQGLKGTLYAVPGAWEFVRHALVDLDNEFRVVASQDCDPPDASDFSGAEGLAG